MTADSLIDVGTALWLGFMGACVGSFVNVVAYRLPLGMSVVWKPSHCPKCSHPIRARDNVPVLGWLWLRGRCRDCGQSIAARYALVELLVGVAFFLLAQVELFSGGANLLRGPVSEFTGASAVVWNPQWQVIGIYACHCVLVCLLMCIGLMDLDGEKASWNFLVFSILVGAIAAIFGKWAQLPGVFGFGAFCAGGAAGAAVGFGSAWMGRMCVGPKQVGEKTAHEDQHTCTLCTHPHNLIAGCLIGGVFLGPAEILSVALVAIVVVVVARLGTRYVLGRESQLLPISGLACLWIAVLVQLLFGKPLAGVFF